MEFHPDTSLFHAKSDAWAKKTLPLPGREQQACGLAGLISSVKQSRCRRGPAWWQQVQSCWGYFFFQVSEYLLDRYRVFNTGNGLDRATAFAAGFEATASSATAPALL